MGRGQRARAICDREEVVPNSGIVARRSSRTDRDRAQQRAVGGRNRPVREKDFVPWLTSPTSPFSASPSPRSTMIGQVQADGLSIASILLDAPMPHGGGGSAAPRALATCTSLAEGFNEWSSCLAVVLHMCGVPSFWTERGKESSNLQAAFEDPD
jgi:hypothetical protein